MNVGQGGSGLRVSKGRVARQAPGPMVGSFVAIRMLVMFAVVVMLVSEPTPGCHLTIQKRRLRPPVQPPPGVRPNEGIRCRLRRFCINALS